MNNNHFYLLYQQAIKLWYSDHKDQSRHLVESLLFNRRVPLLLKNSLYDNLHYFSIPLPSTYSQPLTFPLPLLDNHNTFWKPLNPAIIQLDNGYLVNCRLVNYHQYDNNYKSMSPDNIIRTRNFLLFLDSSFTILSITELIDQQTSNRYPTIVEGMEDCRLVRDDENIWISSTIHNVYNQIIPQICLSKIKLANIIPETSQIKVKTTHLKGPYPKRIEKNWLPFIKKGQLYFIYSFDPFIILKPDTNGICKTILSYSIDSDLTSFRGSSPPIPFDNGYLLIIHQVTMVSSVRDYYHRFVWLNKKMRIKGVSPLIKFKDQRIEYCIGLCYSHDNHHLILTVGLNDREAWLFMVEINKIRSLLHLLKF